MSFAPDAKLTTHTDFDCPGEVSSNPCKLLSIQSRDRSSVLGTPDQICVGANMQELSQIFGCVIRGHLGPKLTQFFLCIGHIAEADDLTI